MDSLTIKDDMSEEEIIEFNSNLKNVLSKLPKDRFDYQTGFQYRGAIVYTSPGPDGVTGGCEKPQLESFVEISFHDDYPSCAYFMDFLQKRGFYYAYEEPIEVYWSYYRANDWINEKLEEYKNDKRICSLLREHGSTHAPKEIKQVITIPMFLKKYG